MAGGTSGESRVQVLGDVTVHLADGTTPVLGPLRSRGLAILVAAGGDGVSAGVLADELWFGEAPPSAAASLRNLMSRLRTVHRVDVESTDGRYRLSASNHVDAWELDAALERADVDAVLGLWTGEPYGDIDPAGRIGASAQRITQGFDDFLVRRVNADVPGVWADVGDRIGVALRRRHAADPTKESICRALALFQYRQGDHVAALDTVRATTSHLRDHLGLEPSPELTALELAILRHDDAVLTGAAHVEPGEAVSPTARSDRRLDAVIETGRFVGRRRLLERIGADAKAIGAGSAVGNRLIVLRGPPGSGKTWLLAEAARSSIDAGFQVAYGVNDRTGFLAFQPWAEVVTSLAERLPAPRVRTQLGALHASILTLCPALATGERHDERVAEIEPARSPMSDIDQRHRTFEAVARLVATAADHLPVFVAVDDLQWAADETLALLRHVLSHASPGRLLVVATCRDEATPRMEVLRDHLAEPLGTLADVEPFDETDVAEALLIHGRDPDGADEAARLVRLSGGNPLVVSRLLATHSLAQAPFVDELVSTGDCAVHAEAAIAGLPGRCVEALESLAVIGLEFSPTLAAEVLDTDESETLALIEPAIQHGIIRQQRATLGCSFAHVEFRDALLRRVVPSRRAAVHRLVAQRLPSAASSAPAVVYHLLESLPLSDTAEVRRVGAVALRHLSDQGSYGQARDLVVRLTDDRVMSPDPAERAELARWHARLLTLDGRPDAARSEYVTLADDAEKRGDAALVAQVALEVDDFGRTTSDRSIRHALLGRSAALLSSSTTLGPAEERLAVEVAAERINEAFFTNRVRSDAVVAELRAEADEVLTEARRVGDDRCLVASLNARHMSLLGLPPDAARRAELSDEMVQLAKRLGNAQLLGVALQNQIHDLLQMGQMDRADEALHDYWSVMASCRLPRVRWMGHVMSAAISLQRGDRESAATARELALSIGRRHAIVDARPVYVVSGVCEGLIAGDVGVHVAAVEAVVEAVDVIEWRLVLACCLADAGRVDEATDLLGRYLERLDELPKNVFHQFSLAVAAAAIGQLGANPDQIEAVRAGLEPYRGSNVVVGAVSSTLGPAETYLDSLTG